MDEKKDRKKERKKDRKKERKFKEIKKKNCFQEHLFCILKQWKSSLINLFN